jgi:para-nitrobenzyl esterase
VPVYAYEFNDGNAPERYLAPVGFPYGAAHESEVQYLFTLQNTPFPGVLAAPQQQLAAAMKQYWTNLAKTGSPAALWPRFDRTSQQLLSLVPPRPQVETGFAAEHHCAFWARAS